MTVTVRILGCEVLHISTDPAVEYEEDESNADLGTLGYDRIDAGDPDRYMGFTNGRGDE